MVEISIIADSDVSLKAARRIEIINAASELLATKPAASLAEIAAHAGIGKATLHRYFSSRDDLMLALGYRALEAIEQAIADCQIERGTATEALTRVIEALVPLGDKMHFLLTESIFDTHPEFVEAGRISDLLIFELIQRGQAQGELRSDLSAVWIVYYLNYALFAAWQSVYEGSVARRDAPRLLISTIFNGIAHKR